MNKDCITGFIDRFIICIHTTKHLMVSPQIIDLYYCTAINTFHTKCILTDGQTQSFNVKLSMRYSHLKCILILPNNNLTNLISSRFKLY